LKDHLSSALAVRLLQYFFAQKTFKKLCILIVKYTVGEYLCKKIGSLMAHRLTHLDTTPFHCTECDFKSRTKANLSVHLKTHNSEKPFKCEFLFNFYCI